jgi:Uma2 family endonuclease
MAVRYNQVMATQPHTLVTAEQFYQLPPEEGREFELLDGEVIEMSSATYKHNLIETTATVLLHSGVNGRGQIVPNTDFSDGRLTVLRPDLAVLLGEKPSLFDPEKLPVTIAPDIVIEIISPSESAFRVHRRVKNYLRLGACEVWVVYPEDQDLCVHSGAGMTRFPSTDTLTTPLLPGWSITVSQLFER